MDDCSVDSHPPPPTPPPASQDKAQSFLVAQGSWEAEWSQASESLASSRQLVSSFPGDTFSAFPTHWSQEKQTPPLAGPTTAPSPVLVGRLPSDQGQAAHALYREHLKAVSLAEDGPESPSCFRGGVSDLRLAAVPQAILSRAWLEAVFSLLPPLCLASLFKLGQEEAPRAGRHPRPQRRVVFSAKLGDD